jgi:hypothetical protein
LLGGEATANIDVPDAQAATILDLLDTPESFYGVQQAEWQTDPYEFIVWWHCGYPASNAT